jgi:glucose/arabinose dehydrogenase
MDSRRRPAPGSISVQTDEKEDSKVKKKILKRTAAPFLILILLHLSVLCASCSQTVGRTPQSAEDVFIPDGEGVRVEIWIEDLRIPWSLVFLPGGGALVSERPGTIRLVREDKLLQKPYAVIDVEHIGEGGLMGLAIHPSFPAEPYVYVMHTYRKENRLYNRVIRLRDSGGHGAFDRVIIEGIPGGRNHNGGRIGFGPDRMLYIATGEIFESEIAQDIKSLGGKILRLTPDGEIPEDNPFKDSPVYSYGHRNPQGIDWKPGTNELFESEHGPSGEFGRFGHDEINIILKGGNYGWPEVIGAAGRKPYIDPIVVWKKATPPSGIIFYKGNLLSHLKCDLFVATLRSRALIRIKLDPYNRVRGIQRWFSADYNDGKYGRIRDVVEGPDGAIYFLTNNTDGRGSPQPGDDRIYRIVPKK